METSFDRGDDDCGDNDCAVVEISVNDWALSTHARLFGAVCEEGLDTSVSLIGTRLPSVFGTVCVYY